MLAAIDQVIQKYPSSKWSEGRLDGGGNYYWVELNRSQAASYYQRVLDNFPSGKNAYNCEWRVAWVAYLNRQPDADGKFIAFLRKYPVSANAPNALYWLGRGADRPGVLRMPAAISAMAAETLPGNLFRPARGSAPGQARLR